MSYKTKKVDVSLKRFFLHHIPSISLGFILTLVFSLGVFFYYISKGEQQETLLFRAFDTLNTKTADFRLLFRGYAPPKNDIALVAIDERSLAQHGQWPWERTRVGVLVDELFKNGVKAVGFDVLYPEPSRSEIPAFLTELEKQFPEIMVEQRKFEQFKSSQLQAIDHDLNFAKVVEKYQDYFVAASTFEYDKNNYLPFQKICHDLVYQETKEFQKLDLEGYDFIALDSDLPDADSISRSFRVKLQGHLKQFKKVEERYSYCTRWLTEKDEFSSSWQPFSQEFEKIKNFKLSQALLQTKDWTLNTSQIFEKGRYNGFINKVPDNDGIFRRSLFLVRKGSHILPSMSLRLAMINYEADGGQIKLKPNPLNRGFYMVDSLELTKEAEPIQAIPIAGNGMVRINYRGPKLTYPHISALEILQPQVDTVSVSQYRKTDKNFVVVRGETKSKQGYLAGKTVIIGATAAGLYDYRSTPFDENYPGPEAHATVLDNILSNDLFVEYENESVHMQIAIVILGLLLTAAFAALGAVTGLVFSGSLVAGMLVFDYYWFFKNGVVFNIALPVVFIVLMYLALTTYKYFTEEKQKRVVRGTFEKYVSPSIVSEVMEHPDNLSLGGRKEFMSVFFSDVRGFTTISESLEPEKLSDLLNLYLTPMTELVFKNNGTLDKYMGDAIMAFFGAPIPSNHHADDACRCALQNMERLEELNKELGEMGFNAIDVGIGLNTGYMSVGNMGSETVRSYTVMGDSVNLGARLEGINKQYGTHIIISEFTEAEISETFVRREIDKVKVKGKDKPVRIFELIQEGEPSDELTTKLKHFRLGYHLYHQQKWEDAIEEFKKATQIESKDPVSQLYISRCHEFLASPPEANWDGVFVMKTK